MTEIVVKIGTWFLDAYLIPNLANKISAPSRCQVLPFPASSYSNNSSRIFSIFSNLITLFSKVFLDKISSSISSSEASI